MPEFLCIAGNLHSPVQLGYIGTCLDNLRFSADSDALRLLMARHMELTLVVRSYTTDGTIRQAMNYVTF